MVKNASGKSCCDAGVGVGGCAVVGMTSVDGRGQMVLPKELRDKANIRAGDKLAVVSWEKDGKVCCIALVKASEFAEMVGDIIGPVMKGIKKEGSKNE
jgi:AbrB family looped-hinge helix DNA binding protein